MQKNKALWQSLLVVGVFALAVVALPKVADAATTDWLYPSSNANLNATVTNPSNAYSDNGVNAVFNDTADHKFGDFNISLPAGSVVLGIEVRVQGCSSLGDKDLDIYITEDNGGNWGSHKNADDFDTNCETETEGGSSDKWGRSDWTSSELANGNFAIRIKNDFSSGTVGIDYVAVKIHYGGYQFFLDSPTPPVQTDTFTWALEGEKPGSGKEISHFSLAGCWDESAIESVSINENDPEETDDWEWAPINPPGGEESIKVNNLNNDNDLPATVTVVFNQSYLSNGSVTGWIKQGPNLVSYTADGPNCDTPREATISAQKVVCDAEHYLPDWGVTDGNKPNGTPSVISASTAQGWVDQSEGHCWLDEWSFQWAPNSAGNPGDNYGEAGGDWSTFSGSTTIDASQHGRIWFREVNDSAYVPFSSNINTSTPQYSAEVYCHTDVLNYDNYDYIDGITAGETYHCVAFNVEKTYCGDEVVQSPNDYGQYEQCEGGSQACTTQDGYAGTQTCNMNPQIDAQMCAWMSCVTEESCGDDIKNGAEQCDGTDGVGVGERCSNECTIEKIPTYEVEGYKWNDLNGNGSRDCEQLFSAAVVNVEIPVQDCEPLLSNWTIFIDENENGVLDGDEITTTTDENGWYEFSGLAAGAYRLCEVQQNGWQQTSPTNAVSNPNNCHVVTLPEGSEQDSCNFKYYDGDYLYLHDTCNFGNKELPPQPSLTISKTDSPDPVVPGNDITYTINWSVVTAGATSVVLTDPIPANTTFVSASAPGVYDAVSNTVTWNMGDVAVGNYSATLVVKVNSPLTNGTQITNTATVDSAETTPQAAVAQTTVSSGPVLVVTKTVDTATVNPGQTVNYTVTVTNTGTDAAINVIMTDTLPSGFLTPEGLATVTHTFGNIAAGASATTTFPVVVPTTASAGEVINIVRINADNYTEISGQVALGVIVPVVLGEQIEETPVPQVLGDSTELPVTGSNGLTWMLAGMFVAALVGLGVYLKPSTVRSSK